MKYFKIDMDVCQIKYKFNIYVYKDNKIGNKK